MREPFQIGGVEAVLTIAPPVYEPGGPVCFVRDLQEASEGTEAETLQALESEARARGAVLMIARADADAELAPVLDQAGYKIASAWYVGSTRMGEGTATGIRTATIEDVPRILEIGELARQRKAEYAPVFWRMAPTPREAFAPYITMQVEKPENIALVAEDAGKITGYCIVQGDYVDDYTVEDLADWPTVGVELLRIAGAQSRERGTLSFTIVAPLAETLKCQALESLGFRHNENWHTKPIL